MLNVCWNVFYGPIKSKMDGKITSDYIDLKYISESKCCHGCPPS